MACRLDRLRMWALVVTTKSDSADPPMAIRHDNTTNNGL
jgi:hypothetical protein